MAFLTKKYQDYLDKLFAPKKMGKKFIIPLGVQKLHIGKSELKKSAKGNWMIVVNIDKHELTGDYAPITKYYMSDYSKPNTCNRDGIPYGIKDLSFFLHQAYKYDIVHYPTDQATWVANQVKDFRSKPFWAIISHSQHYYFKDGAYVLREGDNMPVLLNEVFIDTISPIDEKPEFEMSKYPSLLKPLSDEDKRAYNYYLKQQTDDYNERVNSIL